MTRKQFLFALFGAPLAALGVKQKPVRRANQLVEFDLVCRDALRLLEKNLTFAKQINRHTSQAIAGETIHVRTPPRYAGWAEPSNIQPGDRLTFG